MDIKNTKEMKSRLVCFFFCSIMGLSAGDGPEFFFPPFEPVDIGEPVRTLEGNPQDEDIDAIPVKDLRAIMTSGDMPEQEQAAVLLIKKNDLETILRVIYSLKQGNLVAREILSDSHSLAIIPYLMEDVAHGSLDSFQRYSFGDVVLGGGRVREKVVELVASTFRIAQEEIAPKFSEATLDCLKAIGGGYPDRVQGLSDESRYLVQWWLLNQSAFEAGKWDKTLPLPQEITYPDPNQDVLLSSNVWSDPEPLPPPPEPPPYGSPSWSIPESFEAWSARIVDPKRRNLDFVALSWDGKKVVEHPAKSLDPNSKALPLRDRETRRVLPKNSFAESKNGVVVTTEVLWIGIVAVLIGVFIYVRWMRRKPPHGRSKGDPTLF